MEFHLSDETLNLLEEDEFDWTPPESKMPKFDIFTPSSYEIKTEWKRPKISLLNNLPLNKNRLHVKNLEFKTRLKKLRAPCHIEDNPPLLCTDVGKLFFKVFLLRSSDCNCSKKFVKLGHVKLKIYG